MAETKNFYSNSVADAIRQACEAFSTTQEKLDIEVLETGSAGIFGLCKKRAHIRAGLKKDRRPRNRRISVGGSGTEKKAAA